MSNLENVKVGDKLFVSRQYTQSIEVVIKVTKLHVLTDSHKFRKNGYLVRDDGLVRTYARPATEADILEIKRLARRMNMLSKCRDIKFENLQDFQLEQILEIINN